MYGLTSFPRIALAPDGGSNVAAANEFQQLSQDCISMILRHLPRQEICNLLFCNRAATSPVPGQGRLTG